VLSVRVLTVLSRETPIKARELFTNERGFLLSARALTAVSRETSIASGETIYQRKGLFYKRKGADGPSGRARTRRVFRGPRVGVGAEPCQLTAVSRETSIASGGIIY
jgi:hypothetical protein